MAQILILGGGFGGLIAAEKLTHALGNDHQVTLVSTDRRFVFYPALVRLAFGACEPDDITLDLPTKMRELNVRFVLGECQKIDTETRRATVSGKDFNGEISYDYLIIAFGRQLAEDEIPGFRKYAKHVLGIEGALDFGEELRIFSEGDLVVGMCPDAALPVPVCETAFALAERFKDAIDKQKATVTAVFPEGIDDAFGDTRLTKSLVKALSQHQISLITDFPVNEVLDRKIVSHSGRSIPFDLLMLAPPFRGRPAAAKLEMSNEAGYVAVDEFLRVMGSRRIYAVGDIIDLPGPKLAFMAVRQGEIAADNIVSEIEGRKPVRDYKHEVTAIIDQGGADTIFLHYAIWDRSDYSLKHGTIWSWVKWFHEKLWQGSHMQ